MQDRKRCRRLQIQKGRQGLDTPYTSVDGGVLYTAVKKQKLRKAPVSLADQLACACSRIQHPIADLTSYELVGNATLNSRAIFPLMVLGRKATISIDPVLRLPNDRLCW